MINHPNRSKVAARTAVCTEVATKVGREHIAKLAEADGEHAFAREVLAGCWDHRNDVSRAIARAMDPKWPLIEPLSLQGQTFAVVHIAALDPDYRRQPKTDHFCCLCQRDIKTPKEKTGTVHYVDGGNSILSLADEDRYQAMSTAQPGGQEPGEMGCFPIGSECARKLPKGFVLHRTKDDTDGEAGCSRAGDTERTWRLVYYRCWARCRS